MELSSSSSSLDGVPSSKSDETLKDGNSDVIKRACELASLKPVFPILYYYLQHHKWIWYIPQSHTREAVLDALVRARVFEGWHIVYVEAQTVYCFVKELRIGTLTAMAQYLVTVSQAGFVITELWMEPQSDEEDNQLHDDTNTNVTNSSSPGGVVSSSSAEPLTTTHTFKQLQELLYAADLHIISTRTTFDTLLSVVHKEISTFEVRSIVRTQLDANADLIYPPSNVTSLLTHTHTYTETFDILNTSSFSSSTSASMTHLTNTFTDTIRTLNNTLHQVLRYAVSLYSDLHLPPSAIVSMGDTSQSSSTMTTTITTAATSTKTPSTISSECWVKGINSSEILFVTLGSSSLSEDPSQSRPMVCLHVCRRASLDQHPPSERFSSHTHTHTHTHTITHSHRDLLPLCCS
jgi:hypothetical protein